MDFATFPQMCRCTYLIEPGAMASELRTDWRLPLEERVDVSSTAGAVVMTAHDAAVEAGDAGYLDPKTGLFVMTAVYLADRGYCCDNGCRHCPYRQP